MTNLACPLQAAAQQFPDSPAIVTAERIINYREYDELVEGASIALGRLGLPPGARIAMRIDAEPIYPFSLYAAIRAGFVAIPISTRLPQQGVAELCRQVQPNLVIASDAHQAVFTSTDLKVISPHELINTVPQPISTRHKLDFEQPSLIVMTSGSSAAPKEALLSFGNLYFSALGSNANLAFTVSDRWLLSLPLFHVGGIGILFRSILGGGAVVIPTTLYDLAETVQRFQITHLSLVSAQLFDLIEKLETSRLSLPSLKAILLGGSGVSERLLQRGLDLGLPLLTSYGLTEMASQVTTTSPEEPSLRIGSSGRVLPHREIKIAPDGEILVRGETRFLGYVEGHKLSGQFGPQGWFKTGDLGSIDSDGYLTVSGRKDNLFISGGENIQPEQVERSLCRLDSVREAVVVPVPHERYGFRPVAFVKMTPNHTLDASALTASLRELVPSYGIPDQFYPWPDSDASGGLKINRRYLQQLARDRQAGK